MSHVRSFGRFCYDFVVGDDWAVALVVVLGVGVSALLAHHGAAAWWCMPLVVTIALVLSLWRAVRHR